MAALRLDALQVWRARPTSLEPYQEPRAQYKNRETIKI